MRTYRARAALTIGIAFAVAIATCSPGLACAADPPPTAAAKANDVKEARKHFTRAVAFYKDADYKSALVEFQAAYDALPSFKLLYNIGQTQGQVGDYTGALVSFKAYLDQGGANIPKARRAEVEAELRRLGDHVAQVHISVTEPGADVTVTGERTMSLGQSPIAEPILLNGGAWTVTAKKEGFANAEEKITVAGGDKVTLRLGMQRPPPPEPPKTPVVVVPPPEPERHATEQPKEKPRSMTPVWIAGGATVVLTAGAVTTGVLALSAKSDYDKGLNKLGVAPGDLSSAHDKEKTFALASDILGGAAILGAAVTVYLYVTRSPRADAPSAALGPVRIQGVLPSGLYGSF